MKNHLLSNQKFRFKLFNKTQNVKNCTYEIGPIVSDITRKYDGKMWFISTTFVNSSLNYNNPFHITIDNVFFCLYLKLTMQWLTMTVIFTLSN